MRFSIFRHVGDQGPIVEKTAAASAQHYQRRRPEQTPLYRLVRAHYATFAADADAHGANLPLFVKDEFKAYLECGILAHGLVVTD